MSGSSATLSYVRRITVTLIFAVRAAATPRFRLTLTGDGKYVGEVPPGTYELVAISRMRSPLARTELIVEAGTTTAVAELEIPGR